MTLSNDTARSDYVAPGGLATFSYSFKITDKTHLAVYVDGALQTVDTDYTVSDVGEETGGNVVFVVSPTAGQAIAIVRSVPYTQLLDYVNGGPFDQETFEDALDLLVMMIQQLNELLDRSLKFAASSTFKDIVFPDGDTGDLFLKWNAGGTALELAALTGTGVITIPVSVAQGGTGSNTAADARTALGLAIGTNVQAYDALLAWVVANLTAAGQALLGDANAAAQRTTLGLGSIATLDVPLSSGSGGTGTNLTTGYAKASLPAAGVAGKLARVNDTEYGLWMDNGTQWVKVGNSYVNMREAGLKGDGTNENMTTWQAVIDGNVGKILYYPLGYYRANGAGIIITPATSTKWKGDDRAGSFFICSEERTLLTILTTAGDLYDLSLRDLGFICDRSGGPTSYCIGINITGTYGLRRSIFESLGFRGFYYGFELSTTALSDWLEYYELAFENQGIYNHRQCMVLINPGQFILQGMRTFAEDAGSAAEQGCGLKLVGAFGDFTITGWNHDGGRMGFWGDGTSGAYHNNWTITGCKFDSSSNQCCYVDGTAAAPADAFKIRGNGYQGGTANGIIVLGANCGANVEIDTF